MAEADTPSQLAVVQSDEKEDSRSKVFVLERRDAAATERMGSGISGCANMDCSGCVLMKERLSGEMTAMKRGDNRRLDQRVSFARLRRSVSTSGQAAHKSGILFQTCAVRSAPYL